MISLTDLTPAEWEAWSVLFDLAEEDSESWVLVGGQMVFLLAREHNAERKRVSDDADVLVNVRLKPGGTAWLSRWLVDRGFTLVGISTNEIGHRFERRANLGPGKVSIDVLAPEGLGSRTSTTTISPARTVQAPGGSQAFPRSEVIEVSIATFDGKFERAGRVQRPNLLGALVMKAAGIGEIVDRDDPERDWEDAAFMLSFLPDPDVSAGECEPTDRRRLLALKPLLERSHPAWDRLTDDDCRAGTSALLTLLGLPEE
jgi:hypothetical protein